MPPTTHCPACNFDNPPGMRFCGNCGARLPEAETPTGQFRDVTAVPRQLGAMVGADLLERFRQAGLEASGQRRNVTVLFADLTGYTDLSIQTSDEDLFELMQKYIALLAENVYKYEGMVDKFTGDGLMALFGAPIMHENNAELAIRAALDMKADLAKLSREVQETLGTEIHLHIGLHTGNVIVGGIGSDMLMNYTAIGDTVNLAQRLDSVAKAGEILVSEHVFQKTKALFEFNRVPNLSLKGYSQPVTGYRVIKHKAKPSSTRGLEGLYSPMVGRDAELNRLTQIIGALTAYQQGQMAMIVGEAGLGKSRLISEVKSLSENLPVSILEGFSLTYRRSVSYWIFLDVLRQYLNVSTETPADEIALRLKEKVNFILGDQADEILPYLEHLLSLPPSNATAARRIEYLDAGQLRQQIFLAMRDLLQMESHRQPLILILEDLHWADQASLDLLNFLIDTIADSPLAVIAITRPFHEGTLQQISEHAHQALSDRFHTIELQSLSANHSSQLLKGLLAIPNLPEKLRSQIVQRAAGIPLYLEEILRMLMDAGALSREDDHWRFADNVDVAKLGVPDTLQGLILTRFDRLNPEQRRVLQVAAVIGRQVSLPVLEQVASPTDKEQITPILESLLDRQFLLPPLDVSAKEYTFRHVLVSDAIYGTLLKRERSDLHGQVGAAIETIYANRLDEHTDLLARHYSWSPRKDKALHYLGLAGQKAARSFINDQALQHFRDALALLPEVNHSAYQALQLYLGIGDVLVLVGEYQQARENYEKGIDELSCENPASCAKELSITTRKIGETYERQGDYDQALTCFADAQRIIKNANLSLPDERALILNDIGWIYFRRGNLDEGEKALTEALTLAETIARYDIMASVYNRLGGVYFERNQLEQASNYVRKSLILREEMGDIVGVARSYNNLGLLSWRKGDWDQAVDDFSRNLELNRMLGDAEGLVHLHNNMGLLLTDRGKLEEARFHLEESLSGARKIGHTYLEGLSYAHLGHFWLAMEEWEKSIECCQQSLNVLDSIGSREIWVDLYVSMGEAYLGLGDSEQAAHACKKARDLHQQHTQNSTNPSMENGRILRLCGNIARARGDYQQAAYDFDESSKQFAGLDNHLELGRTTTAQALLAFEQGDIEKARELAFEAQFIFSQLHAEIDLKRLSPILPPTTP